MTREHFIERIASFARAHAPTRVAEARSMAAEIWAGLLDPTSPAPGMPS